MVGFSVVFVYFFSTQGMRLSDYFRPAIPDMAICDKSRIPLLSSVGTIYFVLLVLTFSIQAGDTFITCLYLLGLASLTIHQFKLGCHQIVGKNFIFQRDLFLRQEGRIFQLKDLTAVDVTFFGFLRLHFADGQKVLMLPMREYKLPPRHARRWMEPLRENIYRFKQELLTRAQSAGANSSEIHEIHKLAQTLGVHSRRNFIIGNLVALPITIWIFFAIHSWQVNYLKTHTPAGVSRSDFQEAFGFYKGETFRNFKSEFESACDLHKDYNCRFASYMADLAGEKEKSAVLMKIACQGSDPRSCYHVYKEEYSTQEEKLAAASFLDSFCTKENSKNESSCGEYSQGKRALQKK
jgi:hypothetical protein